MDEHTRGCLAIRAERNIKSSNIIETLAGLTVVRGVPEHIRSDIAVLVRCSSGELASAAPGDDLRRSDIVALVTSKMGPVWTREIRSRTEVSWI